MGKTEKVYEEEGDRGTIYIPSKIFLISEKATMERVTRGPLSLSLWIIGRLKSGLVSSSIVDNITTTTTTAAAATLLVYCSPFSPLFLFLLLCFQKPLRATNSSLRWVSALPNKGVLVCVACICKHTFIFMFSPFNEMNDKSLVEMMSIYIHSLYACMLWCDMCPHGKFPYYFSASKQKTFDSLRGRQYIFIISVFVCLLSLIPN